MQRIKKYKTANSFACLIKHVSINCSLLLLSSVFIFLAFPNNLIITGLFPLAFIALIPLFLLSYRTGWFSMPVYGALFGCLSYLLLNNWLAKFHVYALLLIPVIFAVYFMLFLPVLKLLHRFFPSLSWLLFPLAWVVFEYLTSLGFLGYTYGNLGYTQYLFIPFIKIAGITGIWGISLLVVFPSALLAWCLRGGIKKFIPNFQKLIKPAVCYGVIFLTVLCYGFFSKVTPDSGQTRRFALIQQNVDPWRGGYKTYEKSLDILLRLSNQALTEKPDIVIWSETSFVPAINYHITYRETREAYVLVERLLKYLKGQSVPFVIGNDHGEKIKIGTPQEKRIDFNASLLFQAGKMTQIYKKIHLVPFSEHFPYQKQFPGFYKMLLEADTHFWEQGTEYTIFRSGELRFATPICFEDTFGYLCARFVKAGAKILVNMSNDSWSNSSVAERQHLCLSIFRAVENNRYLVRSTNSGITCVVAPNGRIIKTLEPHTENFLIADIPITERKKTLYTLWGDWFPFFSLIILISLISFFLISRIQKKMN